MIELSTKVVNASDVSLDAKFDRNRLCDLGLRSLNRGPRVGPCPDFVTRSRNPDNFRKLARPISAARYERASKGVHLQASIRSSGVHTRLRPSTVPATRLTANNGAPS
jgi:hypothetical protein